jgi:hypothetical protein
VLLCLQNCVVHLLQILLVHHLQESAFIPIEFRYLSLLHSYLYCRCSSSYMNGGQCRTFLFSSLLNATDFLRGHPNFCNSKTTVAHCWPAPESLHQGYAFRHSQLCLHQIPIRRLGHYQRHHMALWHCNCSDLWHPKMVSRRNKPISP